MPLGGASLLADARSVQKQEKNHDQRLNAALNFANLPIIKHGPHLAGHADFSSNLAHSLIRSAQAAQNPNLVSPAYSALGQEQLYRKAVSTSGSLLSNASLLRSQASLSVASTLNQEKGSLSPISLTASDNRSNIVPQHPDASSTSRNASASNNSAVLSSSY